MVFAGMVLVRLGLLIAVALAEGSHKPPAAILETDILQAAAQAIVGAPQMPPPCA